MHIVCCVKQVPDTTQVKIDPATNTLIRTGVESICNPYDLIAVEAAVRLKEKYGGKVTVVSMGPPQTESALRECLSIGADNAVLISDRAIAGADTLATSYTVSLAIIKLNAEDPVSLVLCGKQAIDGDTAQVGPGIATRMNYSQLTYVSEIVKVDLAANTITVKREVDGGTEVIEAPMPALLTAELNLAVTRYPSLPELIRSLRQEVKIWDAKAVNGQAEFLGLKGSATTVKDIWSPTGRTGGTQYDATEDKNGGVDNFLNAIFDKEKRLLDEVLVKEQK